MSDGASGPTITGFNTFIYGVMLIDPLILPPGSPVIGYAYNNAIAIVNTSLIQAGCGPDPQWSLYAIAVYNLGGSNLINFAQDQPYRTWFAEQRAAYGISKFQSGVVSGSSDQGTADSLLNPEFMKTITMRDLRTLKDPWGRAYMEITMDYGEIWGLT